MLDEPHFFSRWITSFSDSVHYTKKQKKSRHVGSFNYFSYTFHIGLKWVMDAAVRDSRDLEVAFFKANST